MKLRSIRALFAPFFLAACVTLSAQVEFHGIGDLPGGATYSEVRDAILTPGGILAVGTSSRYGFFDPQGNLISNGDTPVKWTLSGGLVQLANDFPTNTYNGFVAARVISANGQTFGGSSMNAASGVIRTPALWTNSGSTLTRLGFFGGALGLNVGVNGLSADGSVAYGFTRSATNTTAAFRYTAAGGKINLGYLNPTDIYNFTSAHSASSDGSMVAGNSGSGAANLGAGMQGYRYVYTGVGPTGGVMTQLPALPGGTWTFVYGMTPDGAKILGSADSPASPNGELVLWSADGSVVSLGTPAGSPQFSNFGGLAADGEMAVVNTSSGVYFRNPSGWFLLSDLLVASGVDLTGWEIQTTLGMSADGRLIYGAGLHNGNREGYVLLLPEGFLHELDVTPPVLTLPGNLVVEATGPTGAAVDFSASATDAVDGAVAVQYSTAPGSTFPLGTTTVAVLAADSSDNIATGSFTVTVRDTTAPTISSLTTSAPSLWPPNHKMVAVTVTASISEAVSSVTTKIVSVTSSEPDDGLGDGDTANDIVITGSMSVNLRAERSGSGPGRVYTITVEAKDAVGNVATRTVTVTVPKNQSSQ